MVAEVSTPPGVPDRWPRLARRAWLASFVPRTAIASSSADSSSAGASIAAAASAARMASRPAPTGVVGGEPVVHRGERIVREGRGDGRVAAHPGRREQVVLDRPAHQLVAQDQAIRARR